jgi:hypothetical protein
MRFAIRLACEGIIYAATVPERIVAFLLMPGGLTYKEQKKLW